MPIDLERTAWLADEILDYLARREGDDAEMMLAVIQLCEVKIKVPTNQLLYGIRYRSTLDHFYSISPSLEEHSRNAALSLSTTSLRRTIDLLREQLAEMQGLAES